MGVRLNGVTTLLALLALSACEDAGTAPADGRPRTKPDALTAEIAGPGGPQEAKVQTRKGEILILGLEGRVVPVPLDSADGRRALGLSEARIATATETAAGQAGPQLSAQDALVADFEAQRGDALPALPDAAEGEDTPERPDPRDFFGATVARLQPGEAPQIAGRPARRGPPGGGATLVEVTADMKVGVDADTAFAYATCALASWASRSGTPYARHIRTLQQRVNGRLRVASVFTVSDVEPMGLRVVEATRTLGECSARGIPAA